MSRPAPDLARRDFLSAMVGALACSPQTKVQLDGVRNRAEWAKRRACILEHMQSVMGRFPAGKGLPTKIVRLGETEQAGFTQVKITFLSEEDDHVPAYLLVPKNLERPAPAVLCLHQTVRLGKAEPAGLGGNPQLHYARELAERGYVTLAPDYPNFGEYRFDPYQHGYLSATMKGIWNHRRAVDVLRSLPDVAPDRIGAIGHSLGGHNTLFVGVFDERIKAMISSCGFNSFKKYYGGNLTGWSHEGYMPLIAEKYGKDPARMPFDFPELIAALAPRPLFVNAPLRDANFEVSGVKDCVAAALPIYDRVFHAAERLVAVYPDAGHEFPPEVRKMAYQFFDRWLA